MADQKLSSLAAATLSDSDNVYVDDGGVSKKAALSDLVTYLHSKGMNQVKRLTADRTIATTAGTKVTDLDVTLAAGTYIANWYILAQSATAGVSPMFAVNFTGTAAVRAFKLRYPATGTTAISGVADDAGANTGQIEESIAFKGYGTSANVGPTGGVATINTDILYIIEGLLVVTASGDLQIYHGSETATNTTMKAGSSLQVIRTA